MKYVLISVSVLILAVFGFSFIPTDNSSKQYSYFCYRSQAWAEERKKEADKARNTPPKCDKNGCEMDLRSLISKEDNDITIDNMTKYVVTKEKSGLRRSIEGRLKWLGIDEGLDFLNTIKCEEY